VKAIGPNMDLFIQISEKTIKKLILLEFNNFERKTFVRDQTGLYKQEFCYAKCLNIVVFITLLTIKIIFIL
jgi:hypothetical protein